VTERVAPDYPDVEVSHQLVDSMAMKLIEQPTAYDVIVTENMFGDILSDLAASVSGGIGLAPSSSLGASRPGLYEAIHGSAPDIAGRGIADPTAAILSAALLLEHSGHPDAGRRIRDAVDADLDARVGGAATGRSTSEVGDAIVDRISTSKEQA
jgi:3-isopropylmalate dehydrogenase